MLLLLTPRARDFNAFGGHLGAITGSDGIIKWYL